MEGCIKMKTVRALVLTGYGLNCDYETDYAFKSAGAESHRVHINELIMGEKWGSAASLDDYQVVVFGGGFAWADDHGAGVIFATKLRFNIGEQIERFIQQGKLVMGICNGFQCLVNLGLLPAFKNNYQERRVALLTNDHRNYINVWVKLRLNPQSPCVFTRGMGFIEVPVRHGEGKFTAEPADIQQLFSANQVVAQYAKENGEPAQGEWPLNPNGAMHDIAGICDPTGRIFGLMPHPEAFNHFTNHPNWTLKKEALLRAGKKLDNLEGDGIKLFRNAVEYCKKEL